MLWEAREQFILSLSLNVSVGPWLRKAAAFRQCSFEGYMSSTIESSLQYAVLGALHFIADTSSSSLHLNSSTNLNQSRSHSSALHHTSTHHKLLPSHRPSS